MPVGIHARGGEGWKSTLPATKDDALQALHGIRTHLSLQGKASGVLTLVNRTKPDAELTLKRKSGWQLLGKGSGNARLNDTVFAMRSLLRNAGMEQAEQALDRFLSADRSHGGNRIRARDMLALLNEHLPPKPHASLVMSTLESFDHGLSFSNLHSSESPAMPLAGNMAEASAKPAPILPPADDLIQPEVRSGSLTQLPVRAGDPVSEAAVDIADIDPDLARQMEENYPRANAMPAAQAQAAAPMRDPQAELFPPRAEADSLHALLQQAQISLSSSATGSQAAVLGEGAFGVVKEIGMAGHPDPLVLKTFKENESVRLSRQRTGGANEAIAAYLTSKKNPGYAKTVRIIQPEYFLITTAGRFLMVDPLGLRAMIKASPARQVRCLGLVMKKADGEEVGKIRGALSLAQKKKLLRGTIETIARLNERGFIHRDIKPANTFFDSRTGQVTLIDTGLMYKSSKSDPASRQITAWAGTPSFMHPRTLTGKAYGTEADLYAAAMMALELHAPFVKQQVVKYFSEKIVTDRHNRVSVEQQDRLFDRAMLVAFLESGIKLWEKNPAGPDDQLRLKAFRDFRSELDDPDSFASTIMDCLLAATETPPKRFVRSRQAPARAQGDSPDNRAGGIDWRDPAQANATYNRLLNDPRLDTGSVGI